MPSIFHFAFNITDLDRDASSMATCWAAADFVLAPQERFIGEPSEQWTMFFLDPFGNPIGIKGFRDLAAVYAT